MEISILILLITFIGVFLNCCIFFKKTSQAREGVVKFKDIFGGWNILLLIAPAIAVYVGYSAFIDMEGKIFGEDFSGLYLFLSVGLIAIPFGIYLFFLLDMLNEKYPF